MKKSQTKSLDRIKAKHAYDADIDSSFGTYHTNDIEAMLDVLDEQSQMLECIQEDLEDLSSHLRADKDRDELANGMVDSMLTLLYYEDDSN